MCMASKLVLYTVDCICVKIGWNICYKYVTENVEHTYTTLKTT